MRHKRTGETRRSCRRMESVIGASEAKEEEREVVREQTRFGECLHSRSADYTRGIFQSIGFKEFHAYLVLPEDEKQEKKGQELLQKGIDDLKMVTKRYARRQERWIRNRLLRRSDRQVPPIYTLDCTNLDQWNSCVYEPAVAIIEAVLRGEKPIQKPLNETVENEKFTDSSNEERHYCKICDRIFIGQHQWNIHMGSTKHERTLKRKRKLEELKKFEKFEKEEELIEQMLEESG